MAYWADKSPRKWLWDAFLVYPPIIIICVVLISVSLIDTGEMGRKEWVFAAVSTTVLVALWIARVRLNRSRVIREWIDRK